ncbi:type I DNA topoisomerase [Candidatus Amesbacteria bacterium]|nr:type I DNA topoisomerase [Candidatus Amesbacteria bacterium]
MDLIVVESPTKAKTLAKFLGSGFKIEATMGHIRDLPEKRLGIAIEKNFEPDYMQTPKQTERMKQIAGVANLADNIYLATDPDREGEAISWHISESLKNYKLPARNVSHNDAGGIIKNFGRVTFHEITKSAIENALKHPGVIDMKLVDAQQARRILDRLVGYKLSPLLWKKIRKGLSAGRVQSVAVRLIVEREREITAFKPEEYWEIKVMLKNIQSSVFGVQYVGELKNQTEAEKIEKDLLNTEYRVLSIDKKDFKRTPPAPFTTSTLQQIATNKLGWSAKKTMQTAQRLYEMGFITYHRTDSTNIAAEAATACAEFIVSRFGNEYSLDNPRIYKTKSKVAQEAHEAIRPTNLINQSINLSIAQLNKEEQRLYELIWKRFVACQMAEVTGVSVTVAVTAGKYKLQAKGETINFLGWYKIYEKQSMTTNDDSMTMNDNLILPELNIGEELNYISLEKLQKFTQGPARYNDASLIKAMEELGIGRPSTYAPTLTTITDRQYVEKNSDKRYAPTALGTGVNDFLVTNFGEIMDYKFTAGMEDSLDEIANGKKKWRPVIAEFWKPFSAKLSLVQDTSDRVKLTAEETGEKCPMCKMGDVVIRIGKFGKFLACSTFPTCEYKANYQEKTGQKCEKCKEGDVIIRKTRSGRTFYGCSNYPKCDFASWNKPVPKLDKP